MTLTTHKGRFAVRIIILAAALRSLTLGLSYMPMFNPPVDVLPDAIGPIYDWPLWIWGASWLLAGLGAVWAAISLQVKFLSGALVMFAVWAGIWTYTWAAASVPTAVQFAAEVLPLWVWFLAVSVTGMISVVAAMVVKPPARYAAMAAFMFMWAGAWGIAWLATLAPESDPSRAYNTAVQYLCFTLIYTFWIKTLRRRTPQERAQAEANP